MNVFFLASTPESLEGNYGHVAIDGEGAVFDLDPEHPVSRYLATSDIGQAGAEDLRAAGATYPPEVLSRYLGLPAIDPRIPRLAQQVTATADNNYDKALALRNLPSHPLRIYPAIVAQAAARSPGQFSFRAQTGTLRILRLFDGGHAAKLGHSVARGQRLSQR